MAIEQSKDLESKKVKQLRTLLSYYSPSFSKYFHFEQRIQM